MSRFHSYTTQESDLTNEQKEKIYKMFSMVSCNTKAEINIAIIESRCCYVCIRKNSIDKYIEKSKEIWTRVGKREDFDEGITILRNSQVAYSSQDIGIVEIGNGELFIVEFAGRYGELDEDSEEDKGYE